MERENLDWFKELLERETFDNIPAYSLLYDFNACLPKLKAEILKNKLNLTDNANDYLNLVKAEILAIWDNQPPNINHIKKWLDKYNLNVDDILKLDIKNKEFLLLFQNEHKYFDRNSEERDLSSMIHMDFFIYFKNYFVQQLFKFIDENYNVKKNETKQIQTEVKKPFKDEYLKVFCEEISNERQVKETCFDLLYESIIHYVPYLETEIKENILMLDANKKDDYLEYAIDVISKTPFAKKDSCNIDKWLKKFNVDLKEFPKFSNQELNEWLGKYYNSRIPYDYKEREFILDIQIDFYCYASMIEANKIIDFLESKRTLKATTMSIQNNDINEDNSKQLSVNQIIILLDKLGFFSLDSLEDLPNTKKANLISQIIGKNEKNIKTAIERLELKPSELGSGYQNDIDKIQRILDKLE